VLVDIFARWLTIDRNFDHEYIFGAGGHAISTVCICDLRENGRVRIMRSSGRWGRGKTGHVRY
jgi:hypothetical protein